MNATELHFQDGTPSNVWICRDCFKLYNRTYQPVGDGKGRMYTPEERDKFAHQQAERCCTERPCADCGAGLGITWDKGGMILCQACQRKQEDKKLTEWFTKAEKLTIEQFLESDAADLPIYDWSTDNWFSDLNEAEDFYAGFLQESDRPEHLWCSKEIPFIPDFEGWLINHIYDTLGENASEGISKTALKELRDFEERWWKENRVHSYNVDYNRCVLLGNSTEVFGEE